MAAVVPSTGGITSIVVAGSAAAPTANTQICSTGVIDSPWAYKVVVNTYQTGTVDTNAANMFVRVNGIVIGTLLSTNQFSPQTFRVNVQAGASVDITSGNSAAGAGSVYNASLTVTRLPSFYSVP